MASNRDDGVPERVTVLGAGTMGRGIAQAAAQAGCRVTLQDVSGEVLARSLEAIRSTLDCPVLFFL